MPQAFITDSLDTITQTFTGNFVSSQYILYANGRGQSYWGPSVNQSDIDAISTVANEQFQDLSTSLATLNSSFATLSTYTVSSLTGEMVSSATGLATNFGVLSNQFTILSNNTQSQFQTLSNSLTTQVNNIYNSSLTILESTMQGISSISSFYADISVVNASLQASSSTLSTAIMLASASTATALTTQMRSTVQGATTSTTAFVYDQVSTLSTLMAEKALLNDFSTQINTALLSSTTSLNESISLNVSSLFLDFQGFEASTFSTQAWAISTIGGITTRVVALESLSTQLSSVIVNQVSSYTAPLFVAQDTKFSGYTSTLLGSLSTLTFSTFTNFQAISTLSTTTSFNFSSQQAQIKALSTSLSTLTYEFNVLTTSSILAGVYDTFIELQAYTVELINSTIDSVDAFKSGLLYSTTLQNTSTSAAFFTAYTSSLYLSTVSTLVPITVAYVSSLVSTLYSTGTYYLTSSLDSTIGGKTTEFNSTTTGLTDSIMASTSQQLNSSILAYLSTPAANSLNAFSTAGALAISSFNGQGSTALNTQSTLFFSTFVSNQALLSTLNGQTNSTLTQANISLSTFNGQATSSITAFNTSTIRLFSTQSGQFTSTLNLYGSTLTASANSTNTAVLTATAAAANVALSTIVLSTTSAYNTFVSSLLASASTAQLSTLYTEQQITLTSNNFEGTMDMGTYRNFLINVRAPLVSGSSNYRVTHSTDNINFLNYRQGVITVDVSTIGAGYSNNSGQLALDVYRWGIPTTVFGSVYPYISSADYTAMYSYTILNNIVYTNLLNVYPRLRINALTLAATQAYNVQTGSGTASNFFWRGTTLQLQWSNYSYFPFNTVGAPPYSPDIVVDVMCNNQLFARNGPYPPTTSTLTLRLPYYSNALSNATTIRTYYVGKQVDAAELPLTVLVPKFQELRLTPFSGRFVSLQEIQGWTDSGANALAGLTNTGLYGSVVGSNLALGGSNVTFGKANAVDGNSNTIVLGPTSVGSPDPNAYLQLLPNLTATTSNISSIMVFNVPSASNQARGSGNGATEMESTLLRANVLLGTTQYFSSIRLTTAAVQSFSF